MTARPIATTRDGAAIIADLIRSAGGATTGVTQATPRRPQQPVVAKILTTIADGDFKPQQAALMELQAGVYVDTKQRVQVRHVGSGSVAANTIVTPEPCGRLGLCFTREVQVVSSGLVASRFLRLVGPIDPVTTGSTADYTTAWQFGPWYGRQLSGGQSPIPGTSTAGYYTEQDLSAAQQTVGVGSFRWLKYMQPLRFQVHGFGAQFAQPVYDYQKPSVIATTEYAQETIQLSAGEADVVGISHHLSPMRFSSVLSTMGGVCSTKVVQYISTIEQPAPQFGSASYYSRVLIMFARLWLNGVDKTGILNTHSSKNLTFGGLQISGSDEGFTIAIDSHELIGQTCYLDVWPRYDIRGPRQSLSVTRQVGWIDSANNGQPMRFNSTDYASTPNANDSRWNFAFDADGPAGLATLTAEYVDNPSNGWTRRPVVDGQVIDKFPVTPVAGDKGYSIRFRYVRGDRAQIAYTIYTYVMTGGGGIFSPYLTARPQTYFYSPPDTGDYSGVMLRSGYIVKAGRWLPENSTTFCVTGGLSEASGQRLAEFQYDAQNGIGTIYDGIPLEITVTKAT